MAITSTEQTSIINLVVGMFNAAPGATNLSSIAAEYEANGKSLTKLADSLAMSTAYTDQFAGLVTADGIATKMANNFGMTSGTAFDNAKAYFVNGLNAGQSKAALAAAATSYLQSSTRDAMFNDASTLLANKVTVATDYSVTKQFSGSTIADLRASISTVTTAASSVTAAIATNASGTGTAATPGLVFTLGTAATETLSPNSAVAANKTTAGDDTIRGLAAGDLATADSLDAGAGNDTLTAVLAANITPVLAGIETINISFTGANTLTLSDSSGYTTLNAKGGTAVGIFDSVALGTAISVTDQAVGVTIGFKGTQTTGSADSATVTLADASAAAVVTMNKIETFNVISNNGSTTATTANSAVFTGDTVTSVVITGAQGLTSAYTGSTLITSIDASAATGAQNITYVATTGATTVKGGSASDTLTLNGAVTKALTIDAGAGNDTIVMDGSNAAAITVAGGSGNDVFNFDADIANITSVVSDALIKTAVIKITDYATGDMIDIAATTDILAITETVRDSIGAGKTTLQGALDAAAALTTAGGAGNSLVWFQYGGNTYIYQETAADGAAGTVEIGDGLIEIAGLHTLTAAANFM